MAKIKKIAIVTATRAEYGLLVPLIKRVSEDEHLELELVVTGAHLLMSQGNTIEAIKKDGYFISKEIPIISAGNTPFDVSVSMATALKEFADYFKISKPDMVIILGDRTEMLSVAIAAMNEQIPIAHIHGGEVTEGAVDDAIRHSITKMSYIHFTSTDIYRKRVIQLGENPERVFCVGALGAENIIKHKLMSESDLRLELGIPGNTRFTVVTYHPVTLESGNIENQVCELCAAMDKRNDLFYVITGSNTDAGGDKANEILKEYCESRDNALFSYSLGMIRYLSAVKYSTFVLGNSSSGIIEAPVFGTPTVNIGDRQKGRLMVDTIVNCDTDCNSIMMAIDTALKMPHVPTNIYGDGSTSQQIIDIVKDFLFNDKINLKKPFYDC